MAAQPAGSHTRSSSAASRPARYRPAMMTAFIPKVDSCNAADLTRRDFFFSLSLSPPLREKSRGDWEGRWTRRRRRGGGGGGGRRRVNKSPSRSETERYCAETRPQCRRRLLHIIALGLHTQHTHKKTLTAGNAALLLCIDSLRVSACLVTPPPPPPPPQPPPARWPHPLPCPYMVFLRRARRCNLRSKIPLSLCGKFQHTWEDRGEGEERGRGRTRLLSASYIHFSFQRTHLLPSFFFSLFFLVYF